MGLIDFFVVLFISKWFGEQADDKGYSRHLFRGLTIAVWFIGEVAAVFTALIVGRPESEVHLIMRMESLLIGLGGGAAGLLVIFIIIRCLRERETRAGRDGSGVWACPSCGFRNNEWRRRCFKCNVERPPVRDNDASARPWTCPDCGARNLAADAFCYKCKVKQPARR